ncbi:MAG: thiamine pyrophosphate-binding protein [Parcubacteria group bacterium]|jgi:acetolactate synthase-1/2/3 large subunit
MKCSDFIAEFLKTQGIGVVFDFTGGMITNIEDSISRLQGIECLPVRHEQAAGFAAEGYARANKNFGVAISTSGPGATNMITAIGSCYFDSTPTLFITGQVNSKELRSSKDIRQNGFQELDIVEMVKEVTKYAKLILDPNDILYELGKALFLMKNGRPGPILLDIPFNVQSAEIEPSTLKKFNESKEYKKTYKEEFCSFPDFNKLSELLEKSNAPIVLFGNGIKLSKTSSKLKNFLNKNNLPSVSSLLGLGEITTEQRNYLGFIGTYGNRSANIILANADLIIVLGSRLDLRQTGNPSLFANNAKIFHVDIDEFSKKDSFKDYFFINSDLNNFFDEIGALEVPTNLKWLNFIESVKKNFNDEYLETDEYCNPNLFFENFSSMASKNSVIIADVGQNQMWLAQSWKIKDGQSLLFSGGMGAMGFSLPTSIGAYCADKSKSVCSFMGDGGVQINIQELETIKYNNLPIKIFVLNNNSLGMVREFQDQYFNKNYQSTVIGYSCPNLEKIADAYGIKYFKISKSDNFDLYTEIIDYNGPAIIEVKLSPQSTLQPKVVYGESIENQAPFLSDEKKEILRILKERFLD